MLASRLFNVLLFLICRSVLCAEPITDIRNSFVLIRGRNSTFSAVCFWKAIAAFGKFTYIFYMLIV